MATYTMPLRAIIEHYSQDQPFLSVKEKIEIGRQNLFNFDYPFYDESKRVDFETKFIRYYYMREIGFETEYLFKFHLETWLLTNMDFWNKKFLVNEMEYDPLTNSKRLTKSGRNVDENENINNTGSFERNSSRDETNSVTSILNSDDFNRNLYSETPESRLQLTSNSDGSGTVEYATNITENKQTENETNNVDGNKLQNDFNDGSQITDILRDKATLENTWYETDGKIGTQSYQKMVKEYHDNLVNLETELFDSMVKLFMLIY